MFCEFGQKDIGDGSLELFALEINGRVSHIKQTGQNWVDGTVISAR